MGKLQAVLLSALVMAVMTISAVPGVTADDIEAQQAAATTPAAQKKILLDSKDQFAGKSGKPGLANWVNATDLCKFTGIICNNQTGLVEEITTLCVETDPTSPLYGEAPMPCPGFEDSSAAWVIDGQLPASWSALTSLKVIRLERMVSLTGTIPTSYGSLVNLTNFEIIPCGDDKISPGYDSSCTITSGGITGNIPSTFSQLNKLQTLWIEKQKLSGPMIKTIWNNKPNLTELSLGGNQLNGAIPKELADAKSLEYLDLSNNKFRGSLPAQLSGLSKLLSLYLQNNTLSGAFPTTVLQRLTALTVLDVGYNSFTATNVPAALATNLKSLEELIVPGCKLKGSIPAGWATGFAKLAVMDIGDNSITGKLPAAATSNLYKGPKYIRLTNNADLAGCFPAAVKQQVLYYMADAEWQLINVGKGDQSTAGGARLEAGKGPLAATKITGFC